MKSSRLVPPQASVIHALHASPAHSRTSRPQASQHQAHRRARRSRLRSQSRRLGFAVSKPGRQRALRLHPRLRPRTWRVQIKCTESLNANGYRSNPLTVTASKKATYNAADIDVLVAYILPSISVRSPATPSRQRQPALLSEGNISGRQPARAIPRSLAPLPAIATLVDHHLHRIVILSEAKDLLSRERANSASLGDCHPERSDSEEARESRSRRACLSLPKGPYPLPNSRRSTRPESPMERTMSMGQRVNSSTTANAKAV